MSEGETVKSTVAYFHALKTGEQINFLAFLAWELTILARDTYGAQETAIADPLVLRTMNELQHQILGHLQKLLTGNAQRFPDDVLFKSLFQISETAGHDHYLRTALKIASKRMKAA